MAYDRTKKLSRDKSQFGKGNPAGVISAQSADNAVVGPSPVPVLTRGIRGSPTAAVLLGGLPVHGLFPGPYLFITRAKVTWTFIHSPLIGQILTVVFGLAIARYSRFVTRVSNHFMAVPVSKATTYELMRQADLVVVTGSQNNVRAAFSSGSPAIGVGPGNVPSIVDETADLIAAARRITASKTFDNAASCSSENSLTVVDTVYDAMLGALQTEGAKVLDKAEKEVLRACMWIDGKMNREVVAESADRILDLSGIDRGGGRVSIAMVEEDTPDPDSKFTVEKLSPVLTVYRARDFGHACELVKGAFAVNGKGHSVSIHTRDDRRILRMGLKLPVSVFPTAGTARRSWCVSRSSRTLVVRKRNCCAYWRSSWGVQETQPHLFY